MPEFLERKLEVSAAKKGFTGKRAKQYVFGAMNDLGAAHGNKITKRGEQMEAKHKRDMAKKAGTKK